MRAGRAARPRSCWLTTPTCEIAAQPARGPRRPPSLLQTHYANLRTAAAPLRLVSVPVQAGNGRAVGAKLGVFEGKMCAYVVKRPLFSYNDPVRHFMKIGRGAPCIRARLWRMP